jgi:hypothetical protein
MSIINVKDAIEVLGILARGEFELDFPNIPLPVVDGEVFWVNLAKADGWKLQKNTFFKQCRIIDKDGIRRAWGSEKTMNDLFERVLKK